MPRLNKKAVVLGAILFVIIGAGAAYAYWTTGGTGTGTATTATTTDITAVQTSTVTNMQPGDSAQTLSGNFDNGNSGPVYVATVTAAIAGVVDGNGDPVAGCDATDYTLANAVMTVGAEVPAGTGKGSWSGATIKFNDKAATNQDACKGATVNLTYTIG